jgi:hypothetical protein
VSGDAGDGGGEGIVYHETKCTVVEWWNNGFVCPE